MEYLKIFSSESDYQTFKEGNDWITPNVSIIEENKGIKYNAKKLAFTLNGHYNGDNGVYIFNFLFNKYGLNYEGAIAETITITGTFSENGTYNTITIENTGTGRIYFTTHMYLTSDGYLDYYNHGGGSN